MPPPPVPQLDGSHDGPRKVKSPRRQRKRKSTPVSTLEHIWIDREDNESQEWRPSKRERREGVDTGYTLASTKPRRSTAHMAQPQPKLEIQDSTATDKQDENLPTYPKTRPSKHHPQTPTKERPIILSSQSPESLPPSTKRKPKDMVDVLPPRSPLQQRSINLPDEMPLSSMQVNHYVTTTPQHVAYQSSALQRRPQQQRIRVEDSQSNLWSYPVTSSPKRGNAAAAKSGTSSMSSDAYPDLAKTETRSSALAEIPATSQAHPLRVLSSPLNIEAMNNTPLLNQDSQRRCAKLSEQSTKQTSMQSIGAVTTEAERGTAVAAFTVKARPLQPQDDDRPLPETVTTPRKVINATDDEESEWGSPIANNTQYNVDLDRRTSSPSRSQIESIRTVSGQGADKNRQLQESTEQSEITNFTKGSDPIPRLVSSSRPQSKDGEELQPTKEPSNNSEESLLPTVTAVNGAVDGSITTRILLNDLRQRSSPPADPFGKTTTQRSIRPASMPHPSQMSTQEATQAYLGLSSMMQPNAETQTPKYVKAITIKESSSMRVPLSQIPSHERSQSQGHATVNFGLGNYDDEEDREDLNPPSSEPATRKFPDNKSDQMARDAEPQPSSSPTEELDPADIPVHIRQRLEAAQRNRSASKQPAFGPATGEKEVPFEDQEAASVGDDDFDSQQEADPGGSDIAPTSTPFEEPSQGRKRQHSPIEGFDNSTQSNFTQGGHVTAAYIHKQRELGLLPTAYTPKPYKVPGFTGR